jgi:hypothetical protein
MPERRIEMRYRNFWMVAVLMIGALSLVILTNLARASVYEAETGSSEPAKVEPIEGTSLNRVTLTQKAAERLGVETAAVEDEEVGGAPAKVLPYSAVLYDANGDTWTYTNPEPLVFVRHKISIDRVDGASAILAEGPDVGTKVVTVGAAELIGTEFGVDED